MCKSNKLLLFSEKPPKHVGILADLKNKTTIFTYLPTYEIKSGLLALFFAGIIVGYGDIALLSTLFSYFFLLTSPLRVLLLTQLWNENNWR